MTPLEKYRQAIKDAEFEGANHLNALKALRNKSGKDDKLSDDEKLQIVMRI